MAFAVAAWAQPALLAPGEVRVSSHDYRPSSSIRVESRLVEVEVVVRDLRGRPVARLTKDDFEVLDNGKKRSLARFTYRTSQQGAPNPSPGKLPGTTYPANPQSTEPPSVLGKKVPLFERFIGLFFDDLNTPPGDLSHAKIAAARFIREATESGDRIGVFSTSGGKVLDFTADAAKAVATARNVEPHRRISEVGMGGCPRITPYEAYLIVNNDFNALRAAALEACACPGPYEGGCGGIEIANPTQLLKESQIGGGTDALPAVRTLAEQIWDQTQGISRVTLQAIRGALESVADMPGKRILLLSSSGFVSFGLGAEQDAIVNEALHDGVVINSLDAKGLYSEMVDRNLNQASPAGALHPLTALFETRSLGDRLDSEDAAMARFAESTGGLLYRNNNDLDYGFRELGLAPAYSYELGFEPDDDGKYHKIKVELKNGSHDFVQARPGYFAPTKEASAPTAAEKLDAEVKASDERSDFPATVRGGLGPLKAGARQITIQTHVDITRLPFEKQKDRHDEKLTFIAGLFDPQGKFITGKEAEMDLALKQDSFERFSKTGITGTMSLEAPPGMYRLRVVVEEAVKGEMTATSKMIQIP